MKRDLFKELMEGFDALASDRAKKPKKKALWDAINAKCRECIYDPAPGNGTWRQQVEACTSPKCPLYPLRAKTTPKKVAFHAHGYEKTSELGGQS